MKPPLSANPSPGAPSGDAPVLDGFGYRVQRTIETDSKMSIVLLATTRKRQEVVLKIARVDQRSRAETNRRAILNTVLWLRRLGRHHGLVRLHAVAFTRGVGVQRGARPAYSATLRNWPGEPEFLVMEYLPGGSLRECVETGELGIEAVTAIGCEMARTLAYCHAHGCVHRDIKPENILFRTPPDRANPHGAHPILVDFGVAAREGELKLVSGSRLWMSPELQNAYERVPLAVDPSWDVYALGLLLCYMITGQRPRRREHAQADVLAYRDHALEVLERNCPAVESTLRIRQLVTAMLDREPSARPSAQAVAVALDSVQRALDARQPLHRRLRPPVPRGVRLSRTRRLQLIVIATLLLALLLANAVASLVSWPSSVDAREQRTQGDPATTLHGDRTTEFIPAQASAPGPAASVPTLVPPTLVPWSTPAPQPPPTLIPFTPPPSKTAAVNQPVSSTPSSATATPSRTPTAAVTPTRVAQQPGSSTPRPGATPHAATTPSPTANRPLAIKLVAPESGISSDQGKVEFYWQAASQPSAEQCFELVFWDPAMPADKRSPVGAGKATRRNVDFVALFHSSDSLLQRLTQSHQEFHWGIRVVACTEPRTVLQDVDEVRVYSYKGG